MKLKISRGNFRNTNLRVPKVTRPVKDIVKQSLFNFLINQNFVENANVLDLYAGSGNLGLEALSNGASYITFVEQDYEAIGDINDNIKNLNAFNQCTVVKQDVLKFLGEAAPEFNLVFVDPPYNLPTSHLFKTAHVVLEKGGILAFAHQKTKEEIVFNDLKCIKEACFGKSCYSVYQLQ